jgi:hypothetical protein
VTNEVRPLTKERDIVILDLKEVGRIRMNPKPPGDLVGRQPAGSLINEFLLSQMHKGRVILCNERGILRSAYYIGKGGSGSRRGQIPKDPPNNSLKVSPVGNTGFSALKYNVYPISIERILNYFSLK